MSHGDLAAFHAEAEAAVTATNAALSGQLHSALAAQSPNGNLVFSPFSLLSVLAMVYAGARGNTARQMKEALDLPVRDELLHLGFEKLNIALKASLDRTHFRHTLTRMCFCNSFQAKLGYLNY
jgi:serpin B